MQVLKFPIHSDLNGLYHYEGSLTTPSCDEIVQWVVMDKPLHVRQNGLVSFNHANKKR